MLLDQDKSILAASWRLSTGQLETGNWKLETGNWQLETGNWKLETDDLLKN
jgi:hypothetical protein